MLGDGGVVDAGGKENRDAKFRGAFDINLVHADAVFAKDFQFGTGFFEDFAGNGVQTPVAPLTDPNTGLVFPDFNATGNPLLQTNLIFPVPCEFISPSLPHCAVIRPTGQGQINAVDFTNALTADGLFIGQSSSFTQLLLEMAVAADDAVRAR